MRTLRNTGWLLLLAVAQGCGGDGGTSSGEMNPGVSIPDPMAPVNAAGADAPAAPAQTEMPAETPPADPVAPAEPTDPGTEVPVEPMDEPAEVPPSEAEPDEHSILSDECGLDTGYDGDEYCILPPPPDKGFQVHIGPDDYENPDPRYVLQPGQESTDNFAAMANNASDIFFFERQYRMRPGAHHMIITESGGAGAGFGQGRRIATANLSADYPADGVIPPENEGVGVPLSANARINVSLHSINVTDKPIIREIWVNFWYKDPAVVTEEAVQLFKLGDPSFAVQPGTDVVLGPYSCTIPREGRLLWLYGHRHANNVRFSTYRVRGSQRDLIYEGFDWEEVLTLEYTSLLENPVADRDAMKEGGWSGVLDLQAGDKLEWECRVVNERSNVLRFSNETYDGEMCIIDGELVGTTCDGI